MDGSVAPPCPTFSSFLQFGILQREMEEFLGFFRQASILIASGQIPPYLQEGLGPWEPSEGQVEELLRHFLTKLKITFSINQTLHEASFNLQAPSSPLYYDPASHCHGNRRGYSSRENCLGD